MLQSSSNVSLSFILCTYRLSHKFSQFSTIRLVKMIFLVPHGPFCNLEKGSGESTVHSDSLGNGRKSGESLPFGSVASPHRIDLFELALFKSYTILL